MPQDRNPTGQAHTGTIAIVDWGLEVVASRRCLRVGGADVGDGDHRPIGVRDPVDPFGARVLPVAEGGRWGIGARLVRAGDRVPARGDQDQGQTG